MKSFALAALIFGALLFADPTFAQTIFLGPSGGGGVPANLTLTNPASAATFTLFGGKTFVVDNGLTLAGTDSTTMTFPATNGTIAATNISQTYSGEPTFNAGIVIGANQSIISGATALIRVGAPTPSTGCGTSTGQSGTSTFAGALTLGASPSTTCVMTFSLGAAHGIACHAEDVTNNATIAVGESATAMGSVTLAFYSRTTGAATSPTAGDVVTYLCGLY